MIRNEWDAAVDRRNDIVRWIAYQQQAMRSGNRETVEEVQRWIVGACDSLRGFAGQHA
jgi:hypothetical protein